MAIEHSAADVELPVGCRRSVETWKAAHCCSEPGERQEASIEATSILKRLRSLRAIVGEVAKCSRAKCSLPQYPTRKPEHIRMSSRLPPHGAPAPRLAIILAVGS